MCQQHNHNKLLSAAIKRIASYNFIKTMWQSSLSLGENCSFEYPRTKENVERDELQPIRMDKRKK
jgi:hypothetical protein